MGRPALPNKLERERGHRRKWWLKNRDTVNARKRLKYAARKAEAGEKNGYAGSQEVTYQPPG